MNWASKSVCLKITIIISKKIGLVIQIYETWLKKASNFEKITVNFAYILQIITKIFVRN